MFTVKVVGQKKMALFEHLNGLYCRGIPWLLLSPTIQKFLKLPILNRNLTVSTSGHGINCEVCLEWSLFSEIVTKQINILEHEFTLKRLLVSLVHMQKTELKLCQRVTVQLSVCLFSTFVVVSASSGHGNIK